MMKLLLFSDLHRNIDKCNNILKEVDVVIGAGDIGNMRKGLNSTVINAGPNGILWQI